MTFQCYAIEFCYQGLIIFENSRGQWMINVPGHSLIGIYLCIKTYIKCTYPDNRIPWDVIEMSWHLMSSSDIFFDRKRRQNSMEMSWHFDGIQQDFLMSFNGIQNFDSFLWYLYGKSPWNCHGIWRHCRPKLQWESMMAFYYEGEFNCQHIFI